MPLPNLVVIGAMKAGTSALHAHLDRHPEIAMAPAKEVNFFFGEDRLPDDVAEADAWRHGHWHRGAEWYAGQFPDAPVRGEASPGYTDPAHPRVAGRMHRLLPDARLVYLVRDPVDRAVSQWQHHRRDGTEPRPMAEALLDPDSQYLDRSRYLRRLRPFLDRFPVEQLLVVVQERLLARPREQLRRIFRHAGADPAYWDDRMAARVHTADAEVAVPAGLRARVHEAVADDVAGLRELLGDDLPEWQRAGPQPPD